MAWICLPLNPLLVVNDDSRIVGATRTCYTYL